MNVPSHGISLFCSFFTLRYAVGKDFLRLWVGAKGKGEGMGKEQERH